MKTPLLRFLLPTIGILTIACNKMDIEKHLVLSAPRNFGMDNFAVIRIDPNGKSVSIDWKGFNHHNGNFIQVPYEEFQVSCGDEKYLIVDDGGNGELRVNNKIYRFDSERECLQVKFGSGVSVVACKSSREPLIGTGLTSIFSEATKIYDKF